MHLPEIIMQVALTSYAKCIDLVAMTQTLDIKFFREARGWSQARLAAELGVDQSTISRLESGGEPRLFVVHALERLAGLYPVEPIDASPSEAATSPTQDTQS